ncbi:ATP-grasp domain-containing protein [Streptomyces sp. 549]|uniref:ATP-grasp domain-containing protein n=1 Tax=Streptomyces sp. 549 TaxID=3049076 RepID=UPI0024C4184A|nr:ATP-grasp domain-containing protein [Streptomyces sp. 549]MDK1475675.1 ATP-grasp domain-containing protein [Streptomyces sp. 549]
MDDLPQNGSGARRPGSAASAAPPRRLHLLALNPTDSVSEGFLPAAGRLGLDVTLLTDQPAAHRERHPELSVVHCEVRDFRQVLDRIEAGGGTDAVFTNSDHLQTQAALAADFLGLPGKDWRAALRCKNKAQLRRALAAAGADTVAHHELLPGDDPAELPEPPWPCVVKPREGVASEDVFRCADRTELMRRCREIRARRPADALIVEEYLDGELHTLETLGDGRTLHALAGFRTELSPPPHFVEERLRLLPALPEPHTARLLDQLRVLGVGLGACHTEYVVQGDRARIIEVNYRAIGDQCDLVLAELLDVPLFEHILSVHLGHELPRSLGARTDGRAVMEYVLADRPGRLTAAPPAARTEAGGVRLDYRPLRAVGETHPVYRTNRDFLGVLRATGSDQRRVEAAVRDFLAAHRWEITPC